MKKLALLLAMALLSACGGSSSTTTSATDTSQQVAGQNGTGTVTFSVGDQAAKQDVRTHTDVLPLKRIIITNPALDGSNGAVYQVYKDGNLTGAQPFDLPYANGYLVEYLEYTVSVDTFRNYSINTTLTPAVNEFANISTHSAPTKYTMVRYARHTLNLSKKIGGTDTVTIDGNPVSGSFNLSTATGIGSVTPPTLTFPVLKTGTLRAVDNVLQNKIPSSIFKYGFNNLSTAKYKVAVVIPDTSAFNTTTWGLKQALGTTNEKALLASTQSYSTQTTPLLTGPYVPTPVTGTDYWGIPVFYAKKSLLIIEKHEPATLFTMLGVEQHAPVVINPGSVGF